MAEQPFYALVSGTQAAGLLPELNRKLAARLSEKTFEWGESFVHLITSPPATLTGLTRRTGESECEYRLLLTSSWDAVRAAFTGYRWVVTQSDTREEIRGEHNRPGPAILSGVPNGVWCDLQVELISEPREPAPVTSRKELFARLGSSDPTVRRSAAFELGCRETDAVLGQPLLLSLARDTDPRVRAAVAFALGVVGTPKAIDALTTALKDADADVRFSALSSLSHLGPKATQAVPALLALLDERETRGCAAHALAQIGPGVGAVAALMKAFRSAKDDAEARRELAGALVATQAPEALQMLFTAEVTDGEAAIWSAASEALASPLAALACLSRPLGNQVELGLSLAGAVGNWEWSQPHTYSLNEGPGGEQPGDLKIWLGYSKRDEEWVLRAQVRADVLATDLLGVFAPGADPDATQPAFFIVLNHVPKDDSPGVLIGKASLTALHAGRVLAELPRGTERVRFPRIEAIHRGALTLDHLPALKVSLKACPESGAETTKGKLQRLIELIPKGHPSDIDEEES